jgi:glycosyl transferase family 87
MQSKETYNQSALSLPLSLRYFVLAILSLNIVSLGYSFAARLLGAGLPYDFPYLFTPGLFFSDFNDLVGQISLFGTPQFFTQHRFLMYPPAALLTLRLSCVTAHPSRPFLLILLAAGAVFAIGFFRIMRQRGVAKSWAALLTGSIAITSYPYLLLLQRGNIEVYVWLAVTFGLWKFYRGDYKWAAVCIGLATAIKIYPFVFIGLFLPQRRYREAILSLFTAAAVSLIALRSMSSDILYAFHWNKIQLQAFGKYYAASPNSLGYDHSFFALVKYALVRWHADIGPAVRPYTWTMAVICVVLYLSRIWRISPVNQILALSILSVTIAPTSYDYTLLSLYGSLAILCVIAVESPAVSQSRLLPFLFLFALVLTPESYIVFNGVRLGGQLRAICLLALLVLALCKPLISGLPGAVYQEPN